MKPFFTSWDRLTMPSYGPETTPEQRERLRYARLITRFILLVLVIVALYMYNLVTTQDAPTVLGVLIGMALLIFGLFLNRAGLVILSGTCCVACSLISIATPIFSGPLDLPSLVLFGQLVIVVVAAGAFLPPVSILLVAALNCLLIWVALIFLPHTRALDNLLHDQMFTYLLPPVVIQIVVSVIMYFVIRNLLTAIRRADRAEEIASLQKEITTHQQARIQENRQMEDGLANLANVLSWVARGKMDARANITQSSALVSIAGPLNTLLQRAQAWKEDADKLARTRFFIEEATKILQDARTKHQPVSFTRTDTALDPFLQEINRTYEPDPTIGTQLNRQYPR